MKVLIGPSGAGKSTFLHSINCLVPPDSGDILLEGRPLDRSNKKALCAFRMQVGMIFQDFNLFDHLSAKENVAIALRKVRGMGRDAATHRADEELARVGLARQAALYPAQLSGGQKQRVGIARALASEPKVLLCDEATSALDPQTTKAILELIRDINQKLGLTVVIITHEMQVIKDICDKVAVIENGVITESGRVIDVFTDPRRDMTKEFISVLMGSGLPPDLQNAPISAEPIPGGRLLVRLTFVGSSAGEPVISSLIRKFDVEADILYGNIDAIKDTPYGRMLLGLSGTPGAVEDALSFLREKDLRIEVIGYVR
jgi:D-methionine transport system ATP-binding protein